MEKMYRLCKPVEFIPGQFVDAKNLIDLSDGKIIPFDPANSDYTRFKRQIAADKAELQDADGNVMSAEEAKAYIATLP